MKIKNLLLGLISLILIILIIFGIYKNPTADSFQRKEQPKEETTTPSTKSKKDTEPINKIIPKAFRSIDDTTEKIINLAISKKEDKSTKSLDEAFELINKVKKEQTDTNLADVYENILSTVKEPTIEHLQITRTAIDNQKEAPLKQYLLKHYEDKLVTIVSEAVNLSKEEVLNQTQIDSSGKSETQSTQIQSDAQTNQESGYQQPTQQTPSYQQSNQQTPSYQQPTQQMPSYQQPTQQTEQQSTQNTTINGGYGN